MITDLRPRAPKLLFVPALLAICACDPGRAVEAVRPLRSQLNDGCILEALRSSPIVTEVSEEYRIQGQLGANISVPADVETHDRGSWVWASQDVRDGCPFLIVGVAVVGPQPPESYFRFLQSSADVLADLIVEHCDPSSIRAPVGP